MLNQHISSKLFCAFQMACWALRSTLCYLFVLFSYSSHNNMISVLQTSKENRLRLIFLPKPLK